MCVCREKASLLFHGSEPWELRWEGAVKDTTPLPGFPPGVLVSFHPTPFSAASPCLSAPDAPRHLPISLSFRNVTGRQDFSSPGLGPAPGTASKEGGVDLSVIRHGKSKETITTPPHLHSLDHTHMQHTQRQITDPGRAGGETSASPSSPAAFSPKTLDPAEHLVPSLLREPCAPAALCC